MGKKGTFILNKQKPFYSWYQYLEGYSKEFVESELKGLKNIKSIYDPFAGSGTTMLYASMNGIKSYYSETNPFMVWVSETKINSSKYCYENYISFEKEYNRIIYEVKNNFKPYYLDVADNEFSKFYDFDVFKKIFALKSLVEKKSKNRYFKDVFMLAIASNLITVSNMVRRGDLRYATEKELLKKDKDIIKLFLLKIESMRDDIYTHGSKLKENTYLLDTDVRNVNKENLVDCVVTSPPYLNGTNYIRNTKLELNFLGFLEKEKDISKFHSKGIIAAINNVSRRNDKRNHHFVFLEQPVEALELIAYDTRITRMITGYFDNMYDAIKSIKKIIKPGGHFSLDIGDSQFSGVHIRTHDYLKKICLMSGFEWYNEEILRKRRSHNGMELTQRIMRFKVKQGE